MKSQSICSSFATCLFALSAGPSACAEIDSRPDGGATRDSGPTRTDSGVAPMMDSAAPAMDSAAPPADTGVAPTPDVMIMPPTDSAVRPMFPAYLRDGRTFDQERDYIAWEGAVDYATIMHRDGTSLPPSEGGGSCGGGCNENVTRISAGGRIRGRMSYVQTFSVQIAATGEGGAGTAVIEACGTVVGRIPTAGGTVAGFTNQPQPAFSVPTAGDCDWSVRAEGGHVYFRAVTVGYRGGAPPTVDLRVNGTNGPATFDGPASFLLSWTSTSASSCTASGSWAGARDLMGAQMMTGVAPGPYMYTVICENGGGRTTDSVMVTVTRPPG